MVANDKLRLFTAVFPPAQVAQRLHELASIAKRGLSPRSIRWTSPEQIHLTLNFLGSVDSARLPRIISAIEAVSRGSLAFPLEAIGIGAFPSPGRPRIVWAGLTGGIPSLQHLKQALDHALTPEGYVPEDRPFHPHLTLGRVAELNASDRRSLAEFFSRHANAQFGQWQTQRVDLMQSVLHPSGAKYTVLQSFPLQP